MNRAHAAHERRTDTELIRLAQRDAAAFRTLYERHASTMQRWLYAQVEDMATARELLAETWAAAWHGSSRFREEGDQAGTDWLYEIARKLVLRYRRDRSVETKARTRLQMRSVSADDGELEDVPRRLDAQRLSPGVREAFEELTFEQQQAIGCRVFDELTYEEMANGLGISETTARARVLRGLEMLRSLFKEATL